ncbi:minor capsid protein [Agrilactobacillus fermenti]|uniref:minor capsid protein n=1 Tax=Agrilactobacillus fermenti TaxID=2586909 RepID=UPI001E3C40AA|nr:minor capsid protein [Agrilactobacillus fermenti]MCD2256419.1 minor capsid protein [Agrilactobacillus fermenti]
MDNTTYWKKREANENKFIADNIKSDDDFNKVLQKHYDDLIKSINSQINDQYIRYAQRNGYTLAEAQRKVASEDVKAFESRATEIVAEARRIYKSKGNITSADFNDEVNQRLRLYNATMRINRLEMLKAEISQEVLDTTVKINADMANRLKSDYIAEVTRQAGILGKDLVLPSLKEITNIVYAQTGNAKFSDLLWSDNDVLKANLDVQLTRAIRQGLNPREIAKQLTPLVRDTVGKTKSITERIARTESARVQTQAQLNSFKKYDYEYCKWIAEPSACTICRDIANGGEVQGERGVYKVTEVPYLPAHPNCRCSLAAWYEPVILTEDEQAAITRYISPDAYVLNDTFRRGLELTNTQKKWVNNLDAALNKLPPYKAKKLYRSITLSSSQIQEFISQYEIGAQIKFDQYVSSSKGIYDPDDTVRIILNDSKTGRDISYWNPSESEVLFKRGTIFKVIDRYVSNGKYKIEVKVID